MPVKRVGRTIYHKVSGKWRKKAKAKSVKSAKRMANLLRGIAHGWHPTRSRKRK
jgi:hypothetical protein